MAKDDADIIPYGFEAAVAVFRGLPRAAQRRVFRPSMRKSATRLRARVVEEIQSKGLVNTGDYRDAWKMAKIVVQTLRFGIRAGAEYPSRASLGIRATDKAYYPYAIEFGHMLPGSGLSERERKHYSKNKIQIQKDVPAIPHVRPALDKNAKSETAAISKEFALGVTKEAIKLASKNLKKAPL